MTKAPTCGALSVFLARYEKGAVVPKNDKK